MNVHERIIAVKYTLRHFRGDGLVDQLVDHLEALRYEYRRDRSRFSTEDIAFLRTVSGATDVLVRLAEIHSPIEVLRRRSQYVEALRSVHSNLAAISDDAFSQVKSYVAEALLEVEPGIAELGGKPTEGSSSNA